MYGGVVVVQTGVPGETDALIEAPICDEGVVKGTACAKAPGVSKVVVTGGGTPTCKVVGGGNPA